jgi:prepilin-type N-terminal cleavage/methylation domain-containing protein
MFKLPAYANTKGFTLIELMVVIAIIAIISVVGVALFTNVQKDARDSKRRAELESIANVFEVNKSQLGYTPLRCAQFGGSVCPGQTSTSATMAIDPQQLPYCISNVADVANAANSGWSSGANPETDAGTCPANYSVVQNNQPVANPTTWKICTLLENKGTPLAFCRTNTQ